jgi:hypothetical protein
MAVPLEAIETEFALPLAAIVKAKLVLTDELLAAGQRERTNRG